MAKPGKTLILLDFSAISQYSFTKFNEDDQQTQNSEYKP